MTSEEKFYPDKLIKLFTVFVVGTASLWLYFFLNLPNFAWKSGLRFALFFTGFYSYFFVITSLGSYYFAEAKKRFAILFEKNKKQYFRISVFVLGVSYITINTIIEKSFWIFLKDIIMVALIFATIPKISEWVDKELTKWSKKQNSKKRK